MTLNGLLTCSAKELAFPHVISDTPVVDLPDHPQLKGITSISFDHMRAQVKIIVDPTRAGVGITIYGDPETAENVNICVRDHLSLGDLNKNRGEYGPTSEILLVLTVPPRISLSAWDFAGNIGLGGVPAEAVSVNFQDNVQFYAECVGQLKAFARGTSAVEVDTVTASLEASLFDQGKLNAERAYGDIDLTVDGEGQFNIRRGIASSAKFISTGSGLLQYGGVIAGSVTVEQRGTGLLALQDVRTQCDPKIVGSGSVSINGKFYRNK